MVSTLGSQISATAMPLLVLALTGSPVNAGIVGTAATVPFLLSLPVGALVDRWNRRTIMLISQVTASVALFSVPLALWLHNLTIAQLVAVAFVQGCCTMFYDVAESAALPIIVPPAQRPTALAQNEARSRGAFLAGPPLGGFLFGLGWFVPFLADAIGYIFSTAGVLLVREKLQGERTEPSRSLGRDMADGLRWLWKVPFARTAVMLVAASNLVFYALVLTLIVLAGRNGASPQEVGVMLGIYGGGGLLGALTAGWLHRFLRPKTVLISINWVWAVLLSSMLLPHDPLVLGVIAAGCAFVGPLWNVVILNYQMAIVPEHMMGRVTSTVMMVTAGVLPVGSLAIGYLLEWLGPVRSLSVLAVAMLVVAIAATVSPSLRRMPATEEIPATAGS
ncbi:MFS transporter [Nonomuraea sp. NPDC052265]|uniref:MFS transporter n=1 Tax=Nonomuraea sp. NPDC052265 TaxID=3364374 RepID=UPI0037CAA5A2